MTAYARGAGDGRTTRGREGCHRRPPGPSALPGAGGGSCALAVTCAVWESRCKRLQSRGDPVRGLVATHHSTTRRERWDPWRQHASTARTPPRWGATIYSVAERAGVSIATVSRVLQGAGTVSSTTAEGPRRRRELNYVPLGAARSLAVRHHEAYGLVLPELTGPYYSELLMGFESRAAELGQSVTLMLTDGKADLARAVRQLATRVDAIAVLGSAHPPPRPALHGQARRHHRRCTPGTASRRSRAENAHGARAPHRAPARDHGRTNLRFVGDPDAAPDLLERYEGFVAAHHERGLTPADPVRAEFRERDGTAVAERTPAGELDRRRPRLRQRRARPRHDGPPPPTPAEPSRRHRRSSAGTT